MRNYSPLEALAASIPAMDSTPRQPRASFIRVPQLFIAALVPLSAVDSPIATMLCALSFALLAGWMRTLASRSGRSAVCCEERGDPAQ